MLRFYLPVLVAVAAAFSISGAAAQTPKFPVFQCADTAGNLVSCGGSATADGSVGSAGTNNATAQSVQGVNGGVPQSVTSVASATAVGPVPVTTTTSALVGKAAAANFYGYSVTMGATAGFLAVLNATAVPTAAAAITPLECVPVPVNGYVARRQAVPDRYTAGLVAVTTSSCSTYTAVTPTLVSVIVQ